MHNLGYGTRMPPADLVFGTNRTWYDAFAVQASENIPAGSIVAVTGITAGNLPTVHLATQATAARADTLLYYSPNRIPSGSVGQAFTYYIVTTSTAGRAIGDPVWLSTAGTWAFAPAAGPTGYICLGRVLTVGGATAGKIEFDLRQAKILSSVAAGGKGADMVLHELVVGNGATVSYTATKPERIVDVWLISLGGGGTMGLTVDAAVVFAALAVSATANARVAAATLANRNIAAAQVVAATANATGGATVYISTIPRAA